MDKGFTTPKLELGSIRHLKFFKNNIIGASVLIFSQWV